MFKTENSIPPPVTNFACCDSMSVAFRNDTDACSVLQCVTVCACE